MTLEERMGRIWVIICDHALNPEQVHEFVKRELHDSKVEDEMTDEQFDAWLKRHPFTDEEKKRAQEAVERLRKRFQIRAKMQGN